MPGVTLNDVVVEWGSHNGANAYNPAKDRLTSGMTQEEVAAFAGATNWNDGLRYLAQGPPVLQEAVLLLDASFSDAGEPRVINRGTGGTALNAKYGSVLGAYVYDGAAVLPGLTGNYLSVPDSAALDITGDIEIVVRVKAAWDATTDVLLGKETSAHRSYRLDWDVTKPRFVFSTDGPTPIVVAASAALSLAADTTYWLKVTRTSATGSVRFYWAADQATEPTSWTLHETVAATAGAAWSGTAALQIGAIFDGTTLPGVHSTYRAIVRNGIDGTTVLDVDLADVPNYATSFTATTGQTVTVNSTSSDTNDPLLLTHTGENYAYFPVSTPTIDSVFAPAAGLAPLDLDVRARLRLDSYTSGSQYPLGQWSSSGNNRSWYVGFSSNNMRIQQDAVGDFSDVRTHLATVTTPATGGQTYWFRWTLDVDNGAGGTTARFYYAPDSVTEPTEWTQVGSDVVTAGVKSINAASTAGVGQGIDSSGRPVGRIYALKYAKVIGGDDLLDIDFTTDITSAGATSMTATSGQTMTVQRATSGRKLALVTRPIWLFGTDDFLEVADNALLDFANDEDFTVMAVSREFGTYISQAAIISKHDIIGTSPGWSLRNGGGAPAQQLWTIFDGTNIPSLSIVVRTTPDNALATITGGISGSQLVGSYNGVAATPATDTRTGTSHNSLPVRIGARALGSADFAAREIVAVAVFRRVLTTDEIAAINEYYGTA